MSVIRSAIFSIFLVFLASNTFAWCFNGRGATCLDGQQNQTNIVLSPQAPIRKREDGGARNKRLKGDKVKHQGYAEFRENFVFGTFEAFATPHQNAKATATLDNKSYAYEYAFNPFLSAKIQKTDALFKEGLGDETEYQHEHISAIGLIRVYLMENLVYRFGGGIGESKVKQIKANSDISSSGRTNIFQMSLYYIWGDEDTMLGLTQTVIEGQSEQSNIGLTSYGVSFGVGF